MKNSYIPLLLLLITFASMPFCIHKGGVDSRGSFGPTLYAGPVRGDEKTKVGAYDPTVLPRTVEARYLSDEASPLTIHPLKDRRMGLEVVPWDRVIIALDDDKPITRAVGKGMGELLTQQIIPEQPYAVTLMLPATGSRQVLPIPGWRIIRIGTPGFPEIPEKPGDSFAFSVQVALVDPRGPLMPWQSSAGIHEMALQIDWKSDGADSSDALAWGSWFATLGRDCARQALQAMHGHGAERPWEVLSDSATVGTWSEVVPQQAGHKVLSWQSAVQEPLIRGWSGVVLGFEFHDRGRVASTIDAVSTHVERVWRYDELSSQEDHKYWNTDRTDGMQFLQARKHNYGWEVATWQVIDKPEEVIGAWIAQAQGGDVLARAQLRRYLLSPEVNELLKLRMQTVLRDNSSIPEMAILGQLPQAQEAERYVAETVAWIRGVSNEQPTIKNQNLVENADPEEVHLFTVGAIPVLMLPWENGIQLWWRDEHPQRRQLVAGDTVQIGETTLTWSQETGLLIK